MDGTQRSGWIKDESIVHYSVHPSGLSNTNAAMDRKCFLRNNFKKMQSDKNCSFMQTIAPIIDGNSELGTHVWSELGYLIR